MHLETIIQLHMEKIGIPSGNRKPEGIFYVQAEKYEVKILKYNFKMK